MHPNNPKAAIEYWQMIESGMSVEEANSNMLVRNGESWLQQKYIPNFDSKIEHRKKPKHWDLMCIYKEKAKTNPEEWRNWQFSIGGVHWEHCDDEVKFLDNLYYRRVEKPQPDANEWFTIDSVPIGEKVDLFGGEIVIMKRVKSILPSIILNNSTKSEFIKAYTHWRPATPMPEGY